MFAAPSIQEDHEAAESKRGFLSTIVRLSFVFVLICGMVYPLAATGVAQLLMPGRANGSLIVNADGQAIGSELIGQSYTDPGLFHGRVSSIDYNAAASGSNNYGPSNPDMLGRTRSFIEQWSKDNPDEDISKLPVDLATNSGSGLDPHITPAAAGVQISRVSRYTGIPVSQLKQLIARHTEGPDLGLFGERRVNVLKLNLDVLKLKAGER
ncbi:potassium-transporting ATPase subunit C [Paenibacillus sp. CAA11]|nr:potassium-transporting ATPase subunit KdpC [Paenibacillus sp. CAA11]AWB46777.1 potassium-transporting ATPase subunit C [Paenibacillus sp. CAA11]